MLRRNNEIYANWILVKQIIIDQYDQIWCAHLKIGCFLWNLCVSALIGWVVGGLADGDDERDVTGMSIRLQQINI